MYISIYIQIKPIVDAKVLHLKTFLYRKHL